MPSDGEGSASSMRTTHTDAPAIDVDSYPVSDVDDGSRHEDDSLSTQSLTNSIYAVQKENGRTYHGYRSGTYPFPNDPNEQERLDFQHCVLHEAMGEQLHFAPLADPRHILDIGTGTGIWATEMGDLYPSALIDATDLSPIQPSSVPENVQFLIEDADEDDWVVKPNYYDYIHTRVLLGCFSDFRKIIGKGFLHTKPGGYMESQEIMNKYYCEDGTMPDDWALNDWGKRLHDAAEESGRSLRIANKLKDWYIAAGFVDVQEKQLILPVNTWPRDPFLKRIGLMWTHSLSLGVSAFSLAFFSRVLGWSKTQIEVYLVSIRQALVEKPPRVHAYMKLYVVWGRKPFPNEVALPPSRDGMLPPPNPRNAFQFSSTPQLGESSRSTYTWSEQSQASSSSNVLPLAGSTAMLDLRAGSVPADTEPSVPVSQQELPGSFKRKHEDNRGEQFMQFE